MDSSGTSQDRRVFSDGAAAVSLWLQSEGFEITAVQSSRTEWSRIRFTVEFGQSPESSGSHADWRREYLDAHEYVVREGSGWTISAFVLLDELGLHPPDGQCRLAGCARDSDCWVVDAENERSRQYCSRHAAVASHSVDEASAPDAVS